MPERIGSKVSKEGEEPLNILDDAASTKSFKLFPRVVTPKVGSKSPTSAYRKAKESICNGTQPKFNPSITIKVIPPKSDEGETLDKAAETKKQFLLFTRKFLQERFFLTLSKRPILQVEVGRKNGKSIYEEHNFHPDYNNYFDVKKNKSQFRGLSYNIPAVKSRSKVEIEKFYQTLKYSPSFSEIRWSKDDWHLDTQFFIIFFPNKSAILVPKVAQFLNISWGRDSDRMNPITNGVFALTEESLKDVGDADTPLYTTPQNLSSLQQHVPLLISDNGWKANDGSTLYPLQLGYSEDLSFLKENYTFALPKEIIKEKLKVEANTYQQYFGIDFNSGEFSASSAIKNKDHIWENILKNSTVLKESAQTNGVQYDLTLDMELFCQYGISIRELQAK